MDLPKEPTLEDAILLAAAAHRGQRDKAGASYILHPLRLMLKMDNDHERMTAVLHDVVEDSKTKIDDLRRAGYPETVIQAVDLLTRRKDEGYDAFIERIKPNGLARKVKLADLEDNMDLRRLQEPGPDDRARLKRYRRAWQALHT